MLRLRTGLLLLAGVVVLACIMSSVEARALDAAAQVAADTVATSSPMKPISTVISWKTGKKYGDKYAHKHGEHYWLMTAAQIVLNFWSQRRLCWYLLQLLLLPLQPWLGCCSRTDNCSINSVQLRSAAALLLDTTLWAQALLEAPRSA